MEFDFTRSTENGPELDFEKLIGYLRKSLKWEELDELASLLTDPLPGELGGATYADCEVLGLFVELVQQDVPSIRIPDEFPRSDTKYNVFG